MKDNNMNNLITILRPFKPANLVEAKKIIDNCSYLQKPTTQRGRKRRADELSKAFQRLNTPEKKVYLHAPHNYIPVKTHPRIEAAESTKTSSPEIIEISPLPEIKTFPPEANKEYSRNFKEDLQRLIEKKLISTTEAEQIRELNWEPAILFGAFRRPSLTANRDGLLEELRRSSNSAMNSDVIDFETFVRKHAINIIETCYIPHLKVNGKEILKKESLTDMSKKDIEQIYIDLLQRVQKVNDENFHRVKEQDMNHKGLEDPRRYKKIE